MRSGYGRLTQRVLAAGAVVMRTISIQRVAVFGGLLVAVGMSASGCGGSAAPAGGNTSAGSAGPSTAVSQRASGNPRQAGFPASVPSATAGIPTSGVCRMFPLAMAQKVLDPTGALHEQAFQVRIKVWAQNSSSCAYSEGIWHGRPIRRYLGTQYECGSATRTELDLARVTASPVPGTGGVVLGESHDEDQLVKLHGGCVFSALLMPDLRSGHYVPGAIAAMTTALMYVYSHA